MEGEVTFKLIKCFKGSTINHNGEFIAHEKANVYFNLKTCKDELEVKCKVLEWMSRAAYKSQPFNSEKKNRELHEFIRKGINQFLDTKFTEDDMELIYTYLGNCVHRPLTIAFIESNYDMSILEIGGDH